MSMSSDTGAIGENLVINDLLHRKCKVYKEVTGGHDVDLVADNGTKLFRIQVKTITECNETRRGVVPVSLERRWRNKGGDWVKTKYTSDMIDLIVVVVMKPSIIVYVPVVEFGDQITMCLRFEDSKNGQKKSVRNCCDFSAEKIIGV